MNAPVQRVFHNRRELEHAAPEPFEIAYKMAAERHSLLVPLNAEPRARANP